MALLGVSVLALAGCGRKGPLDLPPNTASQPSPQAAAAQGDTDVERAKPSLFDPSYGANAPPAAPKGAKRPFVLDPLLNN